jgi:hypothetical protein
MATVSGTFTAAQQASGVFFLRDGETVRIVATVTGSATIALQSSDYQPAAAWATVLTITTTTSGTDYKNTTGRPVYLRLLATAISGSTAYSLADVTGDQVLSERPEGGWYDAAGRRVAYMSDEGLVGPVLTPAAQGGYVHLFDYLTPEEIADAVGLTRTLDMTTNVQAFLTAITAGKKGLVPYGYYPVNNLTLDGDRTSLEMEGYAIFWKNANGPVLTISGDDVTCINVECRDDSGTYTGHGIVTTGNRPKFYFCSALGHELRALHMTDAGAYEVRGQRTPWSTRDTGATGWDMEVVRGLYGTIDGFVASKSTGGVKYTDVGSQKMVNCQVGKVSVLADTSPAGVNGGTFIGNRILGNVAIDLSNAVVIGNQFGSSTVFTWGTGTSGHYYEGNVESSGFTMTNSGNDSAYIKRSVGASGKIETKFGDDASAAIMKATPDAGGLFEFPQIRFPNNFGVLFRNAADDANAGSVIATSGNNMQMAALIEALQLSVITGKSIQFVVNSAEVAGVNASGIRIGVAAGSQSAGVLGLGNGTQTTVGAAGAASALPANPTGYLRAYLGSTHIVIPYYAQA